MDGASLPDGEQGGAVVVDDLGRPVLARYSPEHRREALALVAGGASFREAARSVSFSLRVSTLHRWWVSALLDGGGDDARLSGPLFHTKRVALAWSCLLASEEAVLAAVDLAGDGDGKGAAQASIAAGTLLDKALLVASGARPGKFAPAESGIITEGASESESPRLLRLATAAGNDEADE